MATQQQSKRQWVIWRADYQTEDGYINEPAFRAAIENELAQYEYVGHRLGRGIVAAPIRQEFVAGRYETTGWVFREIFVPAARSEQPPVEAAAEPEVPDLSEFDQLEDEEQAATAA